MKRMLLMAALLGLGLCVWEHEADVSNRVRMFVSSPQQIALYFAHHADDLLAATVATALEAFTGLLIAASVSFSLAIACLYWPRLLKIILPVLVAVQVVPVVVFAPFLVVAFGVGFGTKAALAAIIAFFPIFLNFTRGCESISRNVHDLMDVYGAKRSFRIFYVFIPLATPSIFSGLKVGATLTVLGAIVAEFTGTRIGLGKDIFLTTIRIEPELMVLSLVLSACIGGILFALVHVLERFLGKWYMYSGASRLSVRSEQDKQLLMNHPSP